MPDGLDDYLFYCFVFQIPDSIKVEQWAEAIQSFTETSYVFSWYNIYEFPREVDDCTQLFS